MPVDLGPGRTAIAVSAGDFHACAILDTGQVRCWGGNSVGQLAQGNMQTVGDNPGETPVLVDLGWTPGGRPGRGGRKHMRDSRRRQPALWGLDGGAMFQQESNNIGDEAGETTVSIDLGAGRTAVAVAVAFHVCAILDDGALRCWGLNSDGQLGQGGTDSFGGHPDETPRCPWSRCPRVAA